MGFAEDVRAKINESLVQRMQVAEVAVKKAGETKTQFVSDAAGSKLDLLVLRRTDEIGSFTHASPVITSWSGPVRQPTA